MEIWVLLLKLILFASNVKTMKKILFPTDFSVAADRAFIYALQLAGKTGASVTTMHVYNRPDISAVHLPGSLQAFYDTVDLYEFENYKDSIPSLVKTANAYGFSHVDLKHVLIEGETIASILSVAEKDQVDLIVMGTTGARGLKEIFLGSVTGEILENACCPVLAVPEKGEFDGVLNKVAFATSFQEEEVAALDQLIELLAAFHPEIHCVNVDLAHTENIVHRMDQFVPALRTKGKNLVTHVLNGTDFKESMIGFLETHAIDLFAMVTHKRSLIQELFHYSKTKMLSYHCNTPVLALHINQQK